MAKKSYTGTDHPETSRSRSQRIKRYANEGMYQADQRYRVDILLLEKLFNTLLECKILTEKWRKEYNTIRPHSSLGYRPPSLEAVMVGFKAS